MTHTADQPASPPSSPDDDVMVADRQRAVGVLRHAGYTDSSIATVLAGIQFPLTLRSLERHSEQFGISRSSLVERLGGSP